MPRQVKGWEKKAGWPDRFLAALAKAPNVAAACRAADVDRALVYRKRQDDPEFRRKWKDIVDAAVDEVEEAAFAQAKGGDYRFASMILRTHRAKYREALQTVKHTGADGGPLRIEFVRPEAYDYSNTISALVGDTLAGTTPGSEDDSSPDDGGDALSVCGDGPTVGQVNDGG
jgi:hypothetical protein